MGGLKRERDAGKVVSPLYAKPVAATTTKSSVGLKLNTNPSKRPNIFKVADSNATHTKQPVPPQSAAESLMLNGGRWSRKLLEDDPSALTTHARVRP